MVKKKRKLKEMQWFPNLFLQKQHFEFFFKVRKKYQEVQEKTKVSSESRRLYFRNRSFYSFFFLVAGTVDDFF